MCKVHANPIQNTKLSFNLCSNVCDAQQNKSYCVQKVYCFVVAYIYKKENVIEFVKLDTDIVLSTVDMLFNQMQNKKCHTVGHTITIGSTSLSYHKFDDFNLAIVIFPRACVLCWPNP